MLTRDEQPIIALCTPKGSGAIAIIRITGIGCINIIDQFAKLSSGKNLIDLQSHTIHHGHIIDPTTKNFIDEVLFFLMKVPKTFTGQDTIEVSCHNNPFIINKIIELSILHGARHAEPGEFTQRAYLNNKIDLLQAEAIHDVITAQTQAAVKKSMEQLHGTFSSKVKEIEKKLVIILALVESSFEFLDEEQQDLGINKKIIKTLDELVASIENVKSNYSQQQRIKQGIRIALLGNVNVGKSTLFNTLVKHDRAIVTKHAGTTRDCIESNLYKNGNFWLLLDTAGLRETSHEIEREGIERTQQEAKTADIILLIFDSSQELTPEQLSSYKKLLSLYKNKIILVANKSDKANNKLSLQPNISVSAKNKTGIDTLETAIESKIQELFKSCNAPFLLNERQYHLITMLHDKLVTLKNEINCITEPELLAHHLKEMIEMVAELTGKNVSEQIIDSVFRTFCIGK